MTTFFRLQKKKKVAAILDFKWILFVGNPFDNLTLADKLVKQIKQPPFCTWQWLADCSKSIYISIFRFLFFPDKITFFFKWINFASRFDYLERRENQSNGRTHTHIIDNTNPCMPLHTETDTADILHLGRDWRQICMPFRVAEGAPTFSAPQPPRLFFFFSPFKLTLTRSRVNVRTKPVHSSLFFFFFCTWNKKFVPKSGWNNIGWVTKKQHCCQFHRTHKKMAQCAVIWLDENKIFLACTRPSNSANATVFLASFSVWKAKAALARLSLDSAYSIAKQPLTIHTRRLVQIAATRTRTPSIEWIVNQVETHFSTQLLYFDVFFLVYSDYATLNSLNYSIVSCSIVFMSILLKVMPSSSRLQ